MPRVSVAMPVYNREKYVGEAIESILAQTFADFELIVVDDGSTDGSAQIIQSYAEKDSRVQLIQLKRNMGIAQARNIGNAAACGEFIAIVDSDDVSTPGRLEKQVAFLDANPAIGLVGGNLQRVTADLEPINAGLASLPLEHALIIFDFMTYSAIKHPTVMLRRQYMEAAGGYEPGYYAGTDLELFNRLVWEHKIRVANLPNTLIFYRLHERQITQTFDEPSARQLDQLQQRLLVLMGCEEPAAAQERMRSLKPFTKLSWSQRRLVKRDMRWLMHALVAHELIDAADKPMLVAEMNRRLERVSPRLWQKICHWRRYRLPWLFSERNPATPWQPRRD